MDNGRGERTSFSSRFAALPFLISAPDIYISYIHMFFLSPVSFSLSTQHAPERQCKNEGFAYEILAPLIECLSLSQKHERGAGASFSQKYSMKMTAKPRQTTCACICVYALCVCVLQENGICYGCLPGLGEFGGGGGGCSWGLCGGPLSLGAMGA